MRKQPPPYPVNLVTEMQPDGTMEAVEVIEVPLLVSIRVKFLFGVRSTVVWVAQLVLGITEWIVDVTDKWTLGHIPAQLIEDKSARKDR